MDPEKTQNNTRDNEVSSEENEVYEQELIATAENESENAADNDSSARISSPAEGLQLLDDSTSREICVCTCGNNALAYARPDICPFCGKYIDTKTTHSEATSSRVLASEVALHLTLAHGMESVPQTREASLDVQPVSTDSENIHTRARCSTMNETGNKIPVEVGHSDSPVPVPCPPQLLTYFVLKRDYREANEMTFSLYFVEHSQKGRVATFMGQMEQQQEIRLQLVSFGDEYSSQQQHQHFHTLCLEGGIKVKFELLKQVQRRFRIREEQETFQSSRPS